MEEQLNNLLKQKIDKLNRVFFFVKWVSMVIRISSVLLILLNMYRIVKVLIEPFRDSNALNFLLDIFGFTHIITHYVSDIMGVLLLKRYP